MQGKHLYEYAVIRVLPKVEREEFINVGIILFSKRARYIKVLYHINREKIISFSDELDIDILEASLLAFDKISKGSKDGGTIAQFDIPERFRWLTAIRSSCLQTSRPHPGYADDLDATSQKLFEELVL